MREMICIVCPRGCHLTIDDNLQVSGHMCKRGEIYALEEMKNPTRMLTSTVAVYGSFISRLPVVTSSPIPKTKINDVIEAIKKVKVYAPIAVRDIIIKDVCGLGVDIVATRTLQKENKEEIYE